MHMLYLLVLVVLSCFHFSVAFVPFLRSAAFHSKVNCRPKHTSKAKVFKCIPNLRCRVSRFAQIERMDGSMDTPRNRNKSPNSENLHEASNSNKFVDMGRKSSNKPDQASQQSNNALVVTFTSAERVAAKDLEAKGRRASKKSLARALRSGKEGVHVSDPPPIEEFRRLMQSLGGDSSHLFVTDILGHADSDTVGLNIGEPGSAGKASGARCRKSKAGSKRAKGESAAGGSWAERNPDAPGRQEHDQDEDAGVSMEVLRAGEEDLYRGSIDSLLDVDNDAGASISLAASNSVLSATGKVPGNRRRPVAKGTMTSSGVVNRADTGAPKARRKALPLSTLDLDNLDPDLLEDDEDILEGEGNEALDEGEMGFGDEPDEEGVSMEYEDDDEQDADMDSEDTEIDDLDVDPDEDLLDVSGNDSGIGMKAMRGKRTRQARRQVDVDGEDVDIDIDIDSSTSGEGALLRVSNPTAKRASRLNRADAESAEEVRTGAEKLWLPNVYNGGRPKVAPIVVSKYLADGLRSVTDDTDTNTDPDFDAGMDAAEEDWKDCEDLAGSNTSAAQLEELIAQGVVIPEEVEHKLYSHDEPAPWRVQIVSVVTTSSRNSTALEYVQKVYDHIKKGTNNDKRIAYQILCFTCDDGEQLQPFEELDGMIQMWLESYNTYHLIDGAAMKEAWGAIMPHIMLSPKNLQAILDQVLWALAEDELDGALLTPRLRRLRFRGGAQEMSTGFNTEHLDSEFSTVSVR